MTTEEKIRQILIEYKFANLEEELAIQDILTEIKEAKIKMLEGLEYVEYGDFPTKSYSVIHKEAIQKLISELKEEGKEKGKV
jgi:hypothetical protein